MDLKDIIIYVILALVVVWVLSLYNIRGGSKSAKKSIQDVKDKKKLFKKQKRVAWVLKQFERFGTQVGGGVNGSQRYEYNFIIDRNQITIKCLGRYIKPIELVGIFRFLIFVGVVFTLWGITFLTFNPLCLSFVLCFIPKLWKSIQNAKINAEDVELEVDFPNLYLLLNPKLQIGASAHLAPALEDYLESLDHSVSPTEHLAIRKFTKSLRDNIEIFSDEILALQRQRELYRSPSIINFINVAIQALNGVDNKDKLNAFEQELTAQRLEAMTQRAKKLVKQAEKASFAVYIILLEFIILTFAAKLGGNLDALFNLM